MKIFEDEIKLDIRTMIEKRKIERMNQYKFDGEFINEVMDFMTKDEKQKEDLDAEKTNEEEIELTNFEKIFKHI